MKDSDFIKYETFNGIPLLYLWLFKSLFCWLLICTVVHHAPFFHFVHNTYKIMILIFFSFISYNQHCYSVNGDNKYAFEFFHYFGCVIRGTNSLPFASVWVHSRFLVGSMLLIGLVFCFFLSLPYVLCTQCCQFLWIVHPWLPPRFSQMFIHL